MNKKDLENKIKRLEKKHDQIENPICFTGRCQICNEITALKLKTKTGKKK